MACQLGLGPAPGRQTAFAELVGNGFHHQFMLSSVFVGAEQLLAVVPWSGGASEGIAAEETAAEA
jgi:hypothetical protein